MYKSLKEGWVPLSKAIEITGCDKSTMTRWRKRYKECFDEINSNNANVNIEQLKKHVNKF